MNTFAKVTFNKDKVLEYTQKLCNVLRTNYQSHIIETHRRFLEKGENVEFHQKQIERLSEGEDIDDFTYVIGKKYAKIIHISSHGGAKSAHAFVDMNTGDVYKSASWRAPSKIIRFNLLDDKSREEAYKNADWSGGWLYCR